MAVPKRIVDSKGLWKGKSQLHLSWLPPEKQITESTSELHIDTDAQGAFATLTYTWAHEGKRHEGTMLLAMDEKSKAVEVGWVDSWHQSGGVMRLAGKDEAGQPLKVKGSFAAGDETWGWTIAFEAAADEFKVTMENVTPAGEAEWAVRAVYRKE